MTKTRARLNCSLAIVVALFGNAASLPLQVTKDGEQRLSRLNVAVYTADGRPVTDLTAADFVILEDDNPQPIQRFQAAKSPLRLLLLVDASQSMLRAFASLKTALTEFLGQFGSRDEVSVVSFAGGVRLETDFTMNSDRLRRALMDLEVAHGRGDRTVLFEALQIGLERLMEHPGSRTALVLASDGRDTGSRETKSSEILDQAAQSFVTVYPILVLSRRNEFMEKLATSTAGELYPADEVASRSLDSLAAHLRNHYVLGYRPSTAPKPKGLARVEVKLKDPSLRCVLLPSSYRPRS